MYCQIEVVCFSSTSHASANASATIVLSTMFGEAMESRDPTIRNSNLLPVNANGDVRFLSVASLESSGSVRTPVSSLPPLILWCSFTCTDQLFQHILELFTQENGNDCRRRSLAPSLWSFPGSAADSLKRSACMLTALKIQVSTSRNCVFS